ncbi:MAG: hypothetical protein WC899_05900 [bacterium]
MKKILAAGIGIGLIVLTGVAGAGVVTSLPGGTVVPFPGVDYIGPGPQVFDGIQWTSTNSDTYGGSAFGYTGFYGFGSNGTWEGVLGPMTGLNSALGVASVIDTMTFEFSTPVSGVGGFMNYDPNYGSPVISVYDSGHNLIESHTLNFSTNSAPNQGFFYGFLEGSAVIKYFTLSNSFISIVNLTITTETTETATPSVPKYSCLGFENPMGHGPVTVKKDRVLPLKAQLIDQYGDMIIDTDIASPPVIQVTGMDSGGSNADLTHQELFAGKGTGKKQFVFTADGKWQFNLKTKNYSKPGTYTISILSGNSSEYVIEPSCSAVIVIDKRKEREEPESHHCAGGEEDHRFESGHNDRNFHFRDR